jgi:hypothetical protein
MTAVPAVGIALGMRAVHPAVSVSETVQPKNFGLCDSQNWGRASSTEDISPPVPPPANVSKKQLRLAAVVEEDSISSSDADGHTAIFDIATRTVYLPNGRKSEARSDLGRYLDDRRYVTEKDRRPTPPNLYNLSLREEPFHHLRTIRLIPVGGDNKFGRDGMLALNPFLSADIKRLRHGGSISPESRRLPTSGRV